MKIPSRFRVDYKWKIIYWCKVCQGTFFGKDIKYIPGKGLVYEYNDVKESFYEKSRRGIEHREGSWYKLKKFVREYLQYKHEN